MVQAAHNHLQNLNSSHISVFVIQPFKYVAWLPNKDDLEAYWKFFFLFICHSLFFILTIYFGGLFMSL